MNIIIMGPVGSGKSTQAKILSEKLSVPFIDTGDIYRELIGSNSELGQKIKEIVASGNLVDDEITFSIISSELKKHPDGFVIDGFPRTLTQAERELFHVDKVIYLRLTDEIARNRLALRHRVDDQDEIVTNRLNVYHKATEPILDYYRNKGLLVEIDGSQTIEKIAEDIDKIL